VILTDQNPFFTKKNKAFLNLGYKGYEKSMFRKIEFLFIRQTSIIPSLNRKSGLQNNSLNTKVRIERSRLDKFAYLKICSKLDSLLYVKGGIKGRRGCYAGRYV